jgi:hypothetical protein
VIQDSPKSPNAALSTHPCRLPKLNPNPWSPGQASEWIWQNQPYHHADYGVPHYALGEISALSLPHH